MYFWERTGSTWQVVSVRSRGDGGRAWEAGNPSLGRNMDPTMLQELYGRSPVEKLREPGLDQKSTETLELKKRWIEQGTSWRDSGLIWHILSSNLWASKGQVSNELKPAIPRRKKAVERMSRREMQSQTSHRQSDQRAAINTATISSRGMGRGSKFHPLSRREADQTNFCEINNSSKTVYCLVL